MAPPDKKRKREADDAGPSDAEPRKEVIDLNETISSLNFGDINMMTWEKSDAHVSGDVPTVKLPMKYPDEVVHEKVPGDGNLGTIRAKDSAAIFFAEDPLANPEDHRYIGSVVAKPEYVKALANTLLERALRLNKGQINFTIEFCELPCQRRERRQRSPRVRNRTMDGSNSLSRHDALAGHHDRPGPSPFDLTSPAPSTIKEDEDEESSIEKEPKIKEISIKIEPKIKREPEYSQY